MSQAVKVERRETLKQNQIHLNWVLVNILLIIC